MKRITLSLAASAVAVCASVVLAPTAWSAGGGLVGTWTSVDTDGSNQTLDVRGSGRHAYAMVYYDDRATGACDGAPARISGPGFVDGSEVFLRGALVCLPGGNDFGRPIVLGYHYDSSADTLTDDFGIVWHRTS